MSSYIDEKIEKYLENKQTETQTNMIDLTTLNHLRVLPLLLEKIENLENRVAKMFKEEQYDLTKRAGVKKYLNISDSSIAKYLREGIFRQGYHYHREIKNNKSIIIFVSGAIEEFKKSKEK